LDAIEARRAKRQAEAMEAQKAEAAHLKAQAAKQAAEEQQRAGEAKRLQAQQDAAALGDTPEITVDNMNDPQFTQQLRGKVKAWMNSGNPAAIAAATGVMKQVESFSKTGAIDAPSPTSAGTMQSEQADVRMNEQVSQTELNRSMSRVPQTKASDTDVQWATAYIAENDPGKQGISAAWTPNMGMAEQQRKAAMLTDIIALVRRQYAADHGGAMMPSSQVYDLAIYRWEQMQEREEAGEAYAPGPATPAPPPGTPIMAEGQGNLPPGTTGVTGGGQGQPKAKYNWSN